MFCKKGSGLRTELQFTGSLLYDLKLVCPCAGNGGCCLLAYTGVRADSSAVDLCICRNTSVQEKCERNSDFQNNHRSVLMFSFCV